MSYQKIAAGLLSALLVGGAPVPALAGTASAAGTPRTVTVFCFYPSYALKAYAVGSGALGALFVIATAGCLIALANQHRKAKLT